MKNECQMDGSVLFSKIVKRDGRSVDFLPDKIEQSILGAMCGAEMSDSRAANMLCSQVLDYLYRNYGDRWIVSTVQVRDSVERVLYDYGNFEVLREYMVYGHPRHSACVTASLLPVQGVFKRTV